MSRRAVLLTSGGAVVLGAGAGTAAGLLRRLPHSPAQAPPAALVSALAAEERLLAGIQAALAALAPGAPAPLRAALNATRDDHVAHRAAMQAALAGYRPAGTSGSRSSGSVLSGAPVSSTAPTPLAVGTSPAAVRAAEQRASTAAAGWAASLTGRDATLLASIAACEASHATWLGAVVS